MKTINMWFIILSIEEGLHGIVSCTACGQQVNHFQKDSIYRHPTLKVLICKVCGKQFYSLYCLVLFEMSYWWDFCGSSSCLFAN